MTVFLNFKGIFYSMYIITFNVILQRLTFIIMIPTLLSESEYFSKNDDDLETSFVSIFYALYSRIILAIWLSYSTMNRGIYLKYSSWQVANTVKITFYFAQIWQWLNTWKTFSGIFYNTILESGLSQQHKFPRFFRFNFKVLEKLLFRYV